MITTGQRARACLPKGKRTKSKKEDVSFRTRKHKKPETTGLSDTKPWSPARVIDAAHEVFHILDLANGPFVVT